MRPVALASILASTTILCGCAGTVAGVSLSSISSFAGFASTLFTGADLGEHAVSLVTGKDCRFSEGLVREDRDICEERGSAATRADFHGIFVDRIEADGTVVYAAPKFMSASVGAGENENDPDQIWAQIKSVKAQEEVERQLARANAAQQIDVAALATTSVSSASLAFLPASEAIDSDTASQTAQRPRDVVNASAQKPAKPAVETQAVPGDTDQPAIDATTFASAVPTAPGEGGPLLPTSMGGAPVASKLINGQPVVILRLRPAMTAATTTPFETASALPSLPVEDTTAITPPPAKIAARPSQAPSVRSPQAILSDAPAARPTLPASTPTRVAQFETQPLPTATAAPTKPKTKPVATEIAEPAPASAKPASLTPTKPAASARKPEPTAAFVPDADAAYTGPTPIQVPADVPAEPAPVHSEPASAAALTSDPGEPAPSPLLPMQQ